MVQAITSIATQPSLASKPYLTNSLSCNEEVTMPNSSKEINEGAQKSSTFLECLGNARRLRKVVSELPVYQLSSHDGHAMDRRQQVTFVDLGSDVDSDSSSDCLELDSQLDSPHCTTSTKSPFDVFNSVNKITDDCKIVSRTRGISTADFSRAHSKLTGLAKAYSASARLSAMCSLPRRQGSSAHAVIEVLASHTTNKIASVHTGIEAGHAIRLLLFAIDASLVASQV